MNNRSTWLCALGVALSVVWQPGECGRVTLYGTSVGVGPYEIRVVENPQEPFERSFGVQVGCVVCHFDTDDCRVARGTVRAQGKHRITFANGYAGIRWDNLDRDGVTGGEHTLAASIECPSRQGDYRWWYNAARGVDVQWFGSASWVGNPRIIVTGSEGTAEVASWRNYVYGGWAPPVTRGSGSAGGVAVVWVSYAEQLELKQQETGKLLYDVGGDGTILAEFHGVPADLVCARNDDTPIVAGTVIPLRAGQEVLCKNAWGGRGVYQGAITADVMLK